MPTLYFAVEIEQAGMASDYISMLDDILDCQKCFQDKTLTCVTDIMVNRIIDMHDSALCRFQLHSKMQIFKAVTA